MSEPAAASGEAYSMPSSTHAAAWRNWALRAAVYLLAAAGLTALTLWYSYYFGRLTSPAGYDDVVYMMEGMRRVRLMEHDGWLALIGDDLVARTHSPFTIFQAFASFIVWGPNDWAPYATNGLLVFGLLLGVDALLPGRSWWERLLVNAYVLTVPMTMYAIHEFRPDIPNAWWMGLGIVLILSKPLVEQPRARLAGAGLAIAAALLTKPSVTPLTGLLFALALAIAAFRARRAAGPGFDWMAARRAVGVVVAAAVIPVTPFLLVHGDAEANYIYRGLFGEAKVIGLIPMPLLSNLNFYLLGAAGRIVTGKHLVLWAVLLGLAAVYAWRRKMAGALRQATWYAVPTAAAYALVTANHIKSQFLGLAFHALLFFGVLQVLRWGLAEMEARGWPAWRRAAFLAVLFGAGLACARFPPSWGQRDSEVLMARRALSDRLAELLRDDQAHPEDRILFTAVGNVSPDLVCYTDLRDGRPLRRRVGTPPMGGLEDFKRAMNAATWVVASEPDNGEVAAQHPFSKVQAETLAMIRTRADFELVGSAPTHTGKNFYVYRRIRPANMKQSDGPSPQK